MVTVGVHTLSARLMSDRTDQFVVGRRGRLRVVVKAGRLDYNFGQYTPRADDLEDRVGTSRPFIIWETLKAVDVSTVAEVLSRVTTVLPIFCIRKELKDLGVLRLTDVLDHRMLDVACRPSLFRRHQGRSSVGGSRTQPTIGRDRTAGNLCCTKL